MRGERKQLLQPKWLSLLKNIERMDLGIWIGQMFPLSRRECKDKALRSFQQLFPTIFIISLILPISLWGWYVVLLDLFYWRKNPRKDEVELCVYSHMSHQPGLEWATYTPFTLILVCVISLIIEVAGWLNSRPSFLQVDLLFFKNTNVLEISRKWANIMHGSLNQLTCQI